ncbi:MAG: transporter [Myxococcaceae bacterium]|nr:transporter [Myxococcaceae bacterium]
MQRQTSERAVVLLVAMVQFINILDFMMVMPMGPDFAAALGIPLSHLGLIGGSYTLSAMLSGLVGSLFLDRVGRRNALLVAMLGLVTATALGGFARGFSTLLIARVLAGAFGGPATAVSMSIIADTVPAERRGKAMGVVMGAFSLASVFGVPLGLELARRGGWRLPFFAVAALGLVALAVGAALLPPLRGHLEKRRPAEPEGLDGSYRDAPGGVTATPAPPTTLDLLRRPTVLLAYAMSATAMLGGFVLIPNISPYLLHNLGYPRDRLGLLYLCGGLCSFVGLQFAGRLVDRFGGMRVAAPATVIIVAVVVEGFGRAQPWLPVLVVFVLWMTSMSFRNVAMQTVTSRVPSPAERARFMSLQSAVQHGSSAAGAMLSTALLSEGADHRMVGMPRVVAVTATLFAAMPFLLAAVERRLRR